jgi:hypothetical protein
MAWPVKPTVVLVVAEGFAGCDAELLAHEVDAGDRFGDGVLDLETGVDLEEEELAGVVVDEELDRAGRLIADPGREPQGRGAHLGPAGGVERRRGGFLDDLLVTALDGAVTLAEVHQGAVVVAEDLDLDVAGPSDVALDEHGGVSEAGLGLAASGSQRIGEIGGVVHQAHALAPASGGGLDHQREPDGRCVGGVGRGRQHRDAGLGGDGLGGELVAHRGDGLGCRPDPDEPGADDGVGEACVLRQEPVARMDGVGTGLPGGSNDVVGVEIGAGRRTASSAARTCGACSSASTKTATVRRPIARAVRVMRIAISPRLAMSNEVMGRADMAAERS